MMIADQTITNIAAIQEASREFSTALDKATTRASFSYDVDVRNQGEQILWDLRDRFSEMYESAKRPEFPDQVRQIETNPNQAVFMHSIKYHIADLAGNVVQHHMLRAEPDAQREFMDTLGSFSSKLRTYATAE